jgi:hypothetical protein
LVEVARIERFAFFIGRNANGIRRDRVVTTTVTGQPWAERPLADLVAAEGSVGREHVDRYASQRQVTTYAVG